MEKLGKITLYNADCMEILKQTPDKYYSLCIVDPPYGISEDGLKNHSRAKLAKSKLYTPKNWDKSAPKKEYFDELIRVSKNQIIWGANHFISKIPYDSSCWIIWDKNNGKNDFADCELAWTSFKTAVRLFKYTWHGMIQHDMRNKEIRIHPCLPAGEKVYFNNEWKNIEDVKMGDKNSYGTVIDTSNHYADKLIEIVINNKKVIATWNHPFLVKTDNIIYWKNAELITKNDCILEKVSVSCTQKPILKTWNIKKLKKDTCDTQKMNLGNLGLNIVLFGKNIMEKSLLVCKFIILILTKQTILLKTSCLLHQLNTNGITPIAYLNTEYGIKSVSVVENIRRQLKNIGIIHVVGLMVNYVKNVLSKNQLKQEIFLFQKVGSVKTINQKTKVYNLTIDNIPAFDTLVGVSHNTQKPVQLYKWILNKYAKAGDTILDPYIGSGSSAIAAHDGGFEFTGIEIDEEYYNAAKERIILHQRQLSLF